VSNESKRRIVVEIGYGAQPFISLPTLNKEIYVGIEKQPKQGKGSELRKALDRIARKDIQEGTALIKALSTSFPVAAIEADARSLPFKNASVDRIILHDVLNDPDTRQPHKLVAEAFRVLKPGGRLFVREKYGGTLLGGKKARACLKKLFRQAPQNEVRGYEAKLRNWRPGKAVGQVHVFQKPLK